MSAGPALEARFARAGAELEEADAARALEFVAHYLGQGLRNLVYSIAPERIIVGGGVSKLAGFYESVRSSLQRSLAGYPGDDSHHAPDFVVAPGLGDLSGLAGALVLARSQTR